jgi:hypothetical protein
MKTRIAAVLAAALLFGARDARANDWTWTLTPYAWATDVGVDVAIDARPMLETTIPFTDLLKDLDMVAQLRFEAQRGRHGIMADLFDVRLSNSHSKIGMTLFDAGGSYTMRNVSFLYGTRILSQRAEIDAPLPAPAPQTAGRHEVNDTLVDGLVGAQYSQRLSRRWSLQARADASTGGTDYTWSAGADVTFALTRSGRYALTAGYRRLAIHFDTHEPVSADMTMSGMTTGLRVAF